MPISCPPVCFLVSAITAYTIHKRDFQCKTRETNWWSVLKICLNLNGILIWTVVCELREVVRKKQAFLKNLTYQGIAWTLLAGWLLCEQQSLDRCFLFPDGAGERWDGIPPIPQGGFACRRLAVCFGASKGMPIIMKKPVRKDRSYFLNIKMSFGVQSRIVQSFSRVVVVIPRLCFKLLIVREFMPHFSMSVYVDIFFCFINSHKGA